MASQAIRAAVPPLPVWKGGHVSPFAGEGQRLAKRARLTVREKRQSTGVRITRPLSVDEAIALRHDQTKGRRERMQPVQIALPDDLNTLPDVLTTKTDGTPVIKSLDTRSRVFSALYRDLLTRYELILLLEKDRFMELSDYSDFRMAVKRLPVPVAGAPSREEAEALDRWYEETPARRGHKEALEAAQDHRHFMGYKKSQPDLPLDPFPPQAALHFKEGQPMAPAVHLTLRDKFIAVSRLPQFRHMLGLPYFASQHSRTKGQTVLVGIPQFRQDTVAVFLKTLRQAANKAPRELPLLRTPARGEGPKSREAAKPKRLTLVAGMLRGRLLDPTALPELATLPALEALQGQIVGHIAAASGQNVVATLQQATAAGQHILQTLTRAGGSEVVAKLDGYRQSLESDNNEKKGDES